MFALEAMNFLAELVSVQTPAMLTAPRMTITNFRISISFHFFVTHCAKTQYTFSNETSFVDLDGLLGLLSEV